MHLYGESAAGRYRGVHHRHRTDLRDVLRQLLQLELRLGFFLAYLQRPGERAIRRELRDRLCRYRQHAAFDAHGEDHHRGLGGRNCGDGHGHPAGISLLAHPTFRYLRCPGGRRVFHLRGPEQLRVELLEQRQLDYRDFRRERGGERNHRLFGGGQRLRCQPLRISYGGSRLQHRGAYRCGICLSGAAVHRQSGGVAGQPDVHAGQCVLRGRRSHGSANGDHRRRLFLECLRRRELDRHLQHQLWLWPGEPELQRECEHGRGANRPRLYRNAGFFDHPTGRRRAHAADCRRRSTQPVLSQRWGPRVLLRRAKLFPSSETISDHPPAWGCSSPRTVPRSPPAWEAPKCGSMEKPRR